MVKKDGSFKGIPRDDAERVLFVVVVFVVVSISGLFPPREYQGHCHAVVEARGKDDDDVYDRIVPSSSKSIWTPFPPTVVVVVRDGVGRRG